MILMRTNSVVLAALSLVAASIFPPALPAQNALPTATAAKAEPPINPAILLQRAMQANGLPAVNAKPWHVALHWRFLAPNNRVLSEGTYEEWWVNATKFKIAWSGSGWAQDPEAGLGPRPGFQQTRFMTDQGQAVIGTGNPPEKILDLVDDALHLPLPAPAPANLAGSKIVHGDLAMQCVSRGPDLALAPQSGRLTSAYEACFAGDPPALRLEQGIGIEALLDDPERFQGRWIAHTVRLLQEPGPEIDLDFDDLSALSPVVEADFIPPRGATIIPPKVHLSASELQPYRIPGGLPPSYPAQAKAQHIEGTVMVAVVIRRDGIVASVRALSGPPALQDAALAAAGSWRYHPYRVNGQPVEVESEVPVTFSLSAGH